MLEKELKRKSLQTYNNSSTVKLILEENYWDIHQNQH